MNTVWIHTLWLRFGYLVETLWMSHMDTFEYNLDILLIPRGYLLGDTWISCVYLVDAYLFGYATATF